MNILISFDQDSFNSSLSFSGSSVVENPPADAIDKSLTPGPGRFPYAREQLCLCATTIELVL